MISQTPPHVPITTSAGNRLAASIVEELQSSPFLVGIKVLVWLVGCNWSGFFIPMCGYCVNKHLTTSNCATHYYLNAKIHKNIGNKENTMKKSVLKTK